jgi:cation transport ATPase
MLKRFVFILLLVAATTFSHAQIISARVGVNGLTCSQCSRSVEMQLRKLSFVKNVNMNLKQTEGGLEFKEGVKIDFSKIAQAVKDAGFSVRFLTAQIDMSKVQLKENTFKINNEIYMVDAKGAISNTIQNFSFNGNDYSSRKSKKTTPKIAKGQTVYYVSPVAGNQNT